MDFFRSGTFFWALLSSNIISKEPRISAGSFIGLTVRFISWIFPFDFIFIPSAVNRFLA